MRPQLVSLIALFALGACETVSVAPYSPSPDNVAALQQRVQAGGTRLALGTVSTGSNVPSAINCRGVNLDVAQGRSLSDYLRDAIQQELMLAGGLGSSPAETLSIAIDSVRLTTSPTGSWLLSATVTPASGLPFSVAHDHAFKSSFVGSSACPMAGAAFGFAVRGLIQKIVTHPDLPK